MLEALGALMLPLVPVVAGAIMGGWNKPPRDLGEDES